MFHSLNAMVRINLFYTNYFTDISFGLSLPVVSLPWASAVALSSQTIAVCIWQLEARRPSLTATIAGCFTEPPWVLTTQFKLPGAEHFRTADGAADVAHSRITRIQSLFPFNMKSIHRQQNAQQANEKPCYSFPTRGGHSQDGRRHHSLA